MLAAGPRHGPQHLPKRKLKRHGHEIPEAVLVVDPEHDRDVGRCLAVEVGALAHERLDTLAHTMMLWGPKEGDLVGLWDKGQAGSCQRLDEALQAAAAALRICGRAWPRRPRRAPGEVDTRQAGRGRIQPGGPPA